MVNVLKEGWHYTYKTQDDQRTGILFALDVCNVGHDPQDLETT